MFWQSTFDDEPLAFSRVMKYIFSKYMIALGKRRPNQLLISHRSVIPDSNLTVQKTKIWTPSTLFCKNHHQPIANGKTVWTCCERSLAYYRLTYMKTSDQASIFGKCQVIIERMSGIIGKCGKEFGKCQENTRINTQVATL